MSYGRRDNGAVEAIVIGAAIAVVGIFLYRRSGRDWNDDVKLAKGWIDDQTDNAQRVLERTERASKDLVASAKDHGQKALDSAKEYGSKAIGDVKEQASQAKSDAKSAANHA